jgi:hypothetical protein
LTSYFGHSRYTASETQLRKGINMKKLIIGLAALLISTAAYAGGHGGGGGGHGGGHVGGVGGGFHAGRGGVGVGLGLGAAGLGVGLFGSDCVRQFIGYDRFGRPVYQTVC